MATDRTIRAGETLEQFSDLIAAGVRAGLLASITVFRSNSYALGCSFLTKGTKGQDSPRDCPRGAHGASKRPFRAASGTRIRTRPRAPSHSGPHLVGVAPP